MSSWRELIQRAEPAEHLVQLYGGDDQFLTNNVTRYLLEGVKRGDGLLLIATPEHREAIVRQMGGEDARTEAAIREGRLVLLDAGETLARIMEDGQPDWELFARAVGGICEELRGRVGERSIRAFGEMVGLLWMEGRYSAAIRLEEYWNRLLEDKAICLFCAYPIDLFGRDFESSRLQALLGVHTHLLAGPSTMLSSGGPVRRRATAPTILPAT
jgi:MEDS: MEthanogen/methylotroph, DcmR Sensory domain